MRNPDEYIHSDLENWSLRDLTFALGTSKSAELLGVRPVNIRVMRHRNTANMERMKALQDAVREDLPAIQSRLRTLYTIHNTRTHKPKEVTPA